HVRTEHPGIDALTVTVDASEINTLALDPSVESISIDADLTADADSKNSKSTPTSSPSSTTSTSTTSTSTYATLPDGLRQALALGDYALGSTVGVAVLDSGLADNGDFTGRIAAFYDFTASNTGKPVASSPYDDYGHGTHVAGLVGSSGALSAGAYAGIAQTVRFFVLKV